MAESAYRPRSSFYCILYLSTVRPRLGLVTPLPSSVKNANAVVYQRLVSSMLQSVAAVCIALGSQTVHTTRWSQILAENRGTLFNHLDTESDRTGFQYGSL